MNRNWASKLVIVTCMLAGCDGGSETPPSSPEVVRMAAAASDAIESKAREKALQDQLAIKRAETQYRCVEQVEVLIAKARVLMKKNLPKDAYDLLNECSTTLQNEAGKKLLIISKNAVEKKEDQDREKANFIITQTRVNPSAKFNKWNSYSVDAKLEYSKLASSLCMSNGCTFFEINVCLDTIAVPPIPSAAKKESIGNILRECLLVLNR